MYTPSEYVKPTPMQPGLVVCNNHHCEAQYRPATKTSKWYRGYNEGTTSIVVNRLRIQDDCCPVCGTKQA